MVVVELRRPVRNEDGHATSSKVVAQLVADGDDLRIDGEEQDIDLEQRVLSLRDGRLITPRDGAEDWLRSLVATYRSPYLWAEIVEDSEPLQALDFEPVAIRELAAR
jgi:hypothetical protein